MSKKSTTKTKKAAPVKRSYITGNVPILKASDLGLSLERNHSKYPWAKMEVGDAIEAKDRGVATAATSYAKRHGLKSKFASRTKGGKNYIIRIA